LCSGDTGQALVMKKLRLVVAKASSIEIEKAARIVMKNTAKEVKRIYDLVAEILGGEGLL